jgi:hypothetical protein
MPSRAVFPSCLPTAIFASTARVNAWVSKFCNIVGVRHDIVFDTLNDPDIAFPESDSIDVGAHDIQLYFSYDFYIESGRLLSSGRSCRFYFAFGEGYANCPAMICCICDLRGNSWADH